MIRQGRVVRFVIGPLSLDLGRVGDKQYSQSFLFCRTGEDLVQNSFLVGQNVVVLDLLHHGVDQPCNNLRLLDLHVFGEKVDNLGDPLGAQGGNAGAVDLALNVGVLAHK